METTIMLQTPRLILSPPSHHDATELLAYYVRNRIHLKPWEPERSVSFFTQDGMEKRIHDMACAMENGQALHLLLRDTATGAMVGECAFTNIVRGPFQACHLGFSLDHAAQGRGLMQQALSQAIGHVFSTLGLHRIMANTRTDNRRSQALLQRLGFQQEGYARDYLKIDGQWRDHVLNALINPADAVASVKSLSN
jgi:ribosomal-protein-alanine N-acetyltransferase